MTGAMNFEATQSGMETRSSIESADRPPLMAKRLRRMKAEHEIGRKKVRASVMEIGAVEEKDG